MKIAIIGAGAMGCLFACLLNRYDVTLYDVSPAAVNSISRDGILLQEPDGSESRHRIPIRFSGEGQEPQDLVILFVKDTAGEAALRANLGLIGKETVLLSLQNGMGNFEIMQKYVPAGRILLGTTRHNCVTRAPGVIYHSGAGETQVGSPAGDFAMAEATAAALSSDAAAVVACADVKRLLWAKLMINMTVNPMTALLDSTLGFGGENPHTQNIIRMLITEAVAVAAADGVTFDTETVTASVIQSARTLSTGRASMCQDIRAGRRTEIDFINGAVVRLGKQYGIPTPCHELMVSLIHAREDRNDEERAK